VRQETTPSKIPGITLPINLQFISNLTSRCFRVATVSLEKNNKYYVFWMCIYSLIYPTFKTQVLYYIVTYGLSASTKFYYIISKTKWVSEKSKRLWNVFWFSLRLLSETFLTLRRTERKVIKNVYWFSCKIQVILAKFLSNLNILDRFSKNPQI